MRAAGRLRNHPIDQAQRLQAVGRDAEGFRRVRRLVGAFPQDRRAAFGGNHRVDRILHHQRDVADRNRQRAARSAFADDRHHDRHAQFRHRVKIAPDGFRLPAFFRADAGISPRRIDERHDRYAELLRQLHQPQRLAITLRLGHAEISVELILGVASLLMPDHHDRLAAETRQATDDRGILRKQTVALQFLEISKNVLEVVQGVRPLRMPRDLRDLPRRKLAVDIPRERAALLLQARNLFRDVDRGIVLHVAQLLDLRLKLGDRLLEIQECRFHEAVL